MNASCRLVLVICCCCISLGSYPARVWGAVEAVTQTPLLDSTGGSGSYSPSFSADGRFLIFTSRANNLVTNDNNAIWLDVFVRDLTDGLTTLVSISTNGVGGGNGNSFNPIISSNGQVVAFESAAANLVAGDTNGVNDIFVYDRTAGTTTLVSAATNGMAGNGASRHPVITPDGRWVAFESLANNLVAGDNNTIKDVFVRDLQTGTTRWASVGSQTPGVGSESPAISADGQRVAFVSDAALGVAKPKSKNEVYLHDFNTAQTIWASSNVYSLAISPSAIVRSFNPALDVTGRYVVFKSTFQLGTSFPATASNLYYHDFQGPVTALVSSNVWPENFPEISSDGRWVAFESQTNVLLWDRLTTTNTLVSVDTTGTNAASGQSWRPVLSQAATHVAFLSEATNLTADGTSGLPQIYVRDLVGGITRLASVKLNGQPASSMSGVIPALSSDGQKVAFWSADENLVADDQNKDADVFFRDLNAGTAIVSKRHPLLPSKTSVGFILLSAEGASADGRFVALSALGSSLIGGETALLPHVVVRDLLAGTNIPVDSLENTNGVAATNAAFPNNFMARQPVLSANGRYVAYLGHVASDNPGVEQVYLRDLQSPTNWLVSRAVGGGAASASSSALSISRDGLSVAFQSPASNLVPVDGNGLSDVFLRHMLAPTNTLISVNLFGTNSANNLARNPTISRDARWVIFESRATDLVTNSFNSIYFNLFARDLWSNKTILISRPVGETSQAGDCGGAVFNPAGSLVLFTNANKRVYIYSLLGQTNNLVCSNCFSPSMTADGRWVAFETLPSTNQVRDIILLDRQTGITNLVSINQTTTGGGNGSSIRPQLSYDGRYVVFSSRASDLAPNDNNGRTDIFVRDRILNTTLLLSVTGTNAGNGLSAKPLLAADGRSVLFQSFASDLVAGDFNNLHDVFVLRLDAGDSDADGLADDWELAYFGTLERDGMADLDGDGHLDGQEFLAGTDPTNTGSILRVLSITHLNGSTTLLWSAIPGKSYQVQVKTNLSDLAWTDLPGLTLATGSTASRLDSAGGAAGQKYYRVKLAP